MRPFTSLSALALGAVLAFASCKSNDIVSTNNTTTIGQQCNASASDSGASGGCVSGAVCSVNYCRTPCTSDVQCHGSVCLSGPSGNGCQVDQEIKCTRTSDCTTGLVCAADGSCRNFCFPNTPCAIVGDTCKDGACYGPSSSAVDGGSGGQDATMASQDGSGALSDSNGGSQDAGGGSSDGARGGDGTMGNSCPTGAKTQFGTLIATGDSNPRFQSGVGAGNANDLFIFSGYIGPDPWGDGGGTNVAAIYVQAFDPQTAMSKRPAQSLPTAQNLATPGHDVGYALNLYSAAVAPTGQIALVYGVRFFLSGSYDETGLYAAFLDSASDGGAGLQVQKVVLLETAVFWGQPHVVWSNAGSAFVMSWWYSGSGYQSKVAKFLVNGLTAGGNSDVVPTDTSGGLVTGNGNPDQGGAGVSGNLVGVAYESSVTTRNHYPSLTVLDLLGNQVGSSFPVGAVTAQGNWVAVAGTSQGFVYFYDNPSPAPVTEVFVSTSGDAGVAGGSPDGGDAGAFPTFPTFSFPGTAQAIAARAINDDTGGIGGVGLAVLYSTGVSFTYVNADGMTHQGLYSVFAHNYAAADEISMANFNGSFIVSLYDATNHLTKLAASGCAP